MSSEHIIYKFGDFALDKQLMTLYQNGADVKLRHDKFGTKHVNFLLLLLENGGQRAIKEEIIKELWNDDFGGDKNLTEHLFLIRKVLDVPDRFVKEELKQNRTPPFYIQTRGGAYTFVGAVEKEVKAAPISVSRDQATDEVKSDDDEFLFAAPENFDSTSASVAAQTEQPDSDSDADDDRERHFGKYSNHAFFVGMIIAAVFLERGLSGGVLSLGNQSEYVFVLLNSVCYGLLITVCLFLEIAYRYDRYRSAAKKISIPIFLINCAAMLAAFALAHRWLAIDLGWAMGGAFLLLFAATIASCILAAFAVPNRPLVVAEFATQPALMAFWKNTGYWLTAYLFFGILVFCLFFHPSESFAGIGYPLSLFAVFWTLALSSVFGTFYTLADRLLPEKDGKSYPYKTLYTNLLLGRAFFWVFPLAINVSWYLLWSLQRLVS